MKYSRCTESIFMVDENSNRMAAGTILYSEADQITSRENIQHLQMLRNSTHRAQKRVAYIS